MVDFLILQPYKRINTMPIGSELKPEVLRFDSPLGYKVQLGEGQFRKKSRNDVLTYHIKVLDFVRDNNPRQEVTK